MALKNLMEIEGDLFLKTEHGQISKGKDLIGGIFYVKVEDIRATKNKASANVSFKKDKIEFFKKYAFEVSVADNSSNFIKQAYEYLKSLPEFVNSENC
jgi:hypothetical protein